MRSSPSQRTGVLIVRLWIEGEPPGVRARITRLVDVSREEQVVSTASSIDEILNTVRAWLESFTSSY